MLIKPPENSPERSGEDDLLTYKLSIILEGNKSNENALLSDSVEGRGVPLI
jgi:hypothetical protein